MHSTHYGSNEFRSQKPHFRHSIGPSLINVSGKYLDEYYCVENNKWHFIRSINHMFFRIAYHVKIYGHCCTKVSLFLLLLLSCHLIKILTINKTSNPPTHIFLQWVMMWKVCEMTSQIMQELKSACCCLLMFLTSS